MNIGILTSSRADYSIYFPLLKGLVNDNYFTVEMIAFGTHLSAKHGHTIDKILGDGFQVKHAISTVPQDDSPQAISEAIGETVGRFSGLWSTVKYDVVFCLGDRYEMFAACAAAIPFNHCLAHIHGGEQTLGAMDDIFRHSLTHMSYLHFTSTEDYRKRVIALKGSDHHVYNVGALSIDNLKALQLLSVQEFRKQFGIDLSIPSILITYHPETVSLDRNSEYVDELIAAMGELNDYQLIITMPNSDTMGNMVRERLNEFIARSPNAIGVESLGTIGYLTCMKHCSLMLGNTSSGFVEASFFPKYVINLGDRQSGRICTDNIVNIPVKRNAILEAVHRHRSISSLAPIEVYGDGTAARKIIRILKTLTKL